MLPLPQPTFNGDHGLILGTTTSNQITPDQYLLKKTLKKSLKKRLKVEKKNLPK
jgi:hypothetical protein